MGEHGDSDSKFPSPTVRNEVSGVVRGPVVQAHSIHGDVLIATSTPTPSEMDEWTEGLARGMQELWQREEGHRRIHDPVALPVRWHPAAAELTDHWANIRRLPAGATAEPLVLTGNIEQLGEVYRSIPSHRLVLLGPAGAGKTVLASRLALDLLEARHPGQRVPVIVNVGSWNPETTKLPVWLAQQLARDHPGLAARVQKGGPTRAAALIDDHRVMPILDGFDEIDAGLHPAALRQLNKSPQAPMVITSRVEQYTTAVHAADVLTAAAVVELDNLTMEDLSGYLPRTAAGHRTGIWDPILERMRAEVDAAGPAMLRRVLTNPLMVFLARTIYSDTPGNDPTELLDTHRFSTTSAVEHRLLDAFVPAIYEADQLGGTRRWPVERAHQYLTYLASHLQQAGTRDLAWWQLRDTIPRFHRNLAFALIDGMVVGLAIVLTGVLYKEADFGLMLTIGLVYALAVGLSSVLTVGLTRALRGKRPRGTTRSVFGAVTRGLAVGLIISLLAGLILTVGLLLAQIYSPAMLAVEIGLSTGLLFGFAAGFAAGLIGPREEGPQPTRTRPQIRGRAVFIASRFAVGLTTGVAVGFAANVIQGLTSMHDAHGITQGLASLRWDWILDGLVGGPAFALAFGLEAPTDASDVTSVAQSLERDRRNALRKMLTIALLGGLGAWTALSAFEAALPVALVAMFLSVRATSAWIYWLVLVRGWLPLTGRLPWRVQAFLTDAYKRGVLRQPGAVYQFRHARLQDHLITNTHLGVHGQYT
ncbi:NACHT domain-containing protein [Nocardia sp. CA2R105]|uniref:NACHT domain-containing protein n=1 Tax=Nocardia coffeae TaxID=2873381 RepID=UPI001CA6772F|nr:NACHT domain-containing protein [Nocardia coffeae]MBY8863900.1 NACHT domain-containing protein [Nocardia coffeae]